MNQLISLLAFTATSAVLGGCAATDRWSEQQVSHYVQVLSRPDLPAFVQAWQPEPRTGAASQDGMRWEIPFTATPRPPHLPRYFLEVGGKESFYIRVIEGPTGRTSALHGPFPLSRLESLPAEPG